MFMWSKVAQPLSQTFVLFSEIQGRLYLASSWNVKTYGLYQDKLHVGVICFMPRYLMTRRIWENNVWWWKKGIIISLYLFIIIVLIIFYFLSIFIHISLFIYLLIWIFKVYTYHNHSLSFSGSFFRFFFVTSYSRLNSFTYFHFTYFFSNF